MPTLKKEHMETMLRAQLCCSLSLELKQLVTFTAGSLTWDQLLIKLDQTCATSSAQGTTSCLDSLIKTEQQIKSEPIDSFFTEGRRYDRRGDNFFDRSRLGPLNSDRYDRSRFNSSSNDRHDRFDRFRLGRHPHFDGECNYCHTYGHKISECYKRNRASVRQQGTHNNNRSNQNNNSSQRNPGCSSYRYQADTNECEADEQEGESSLNDFPFAEVNSIRAATIVSLKSRVNESVSLVRVKVKLSLFNEPPFTVTALLDNGSTHSFISL